MNRRLHNASLAATVTGFLLAFALVAAEPAASVQTMAPALATVDAVIAPPAPLAAAAAAAVVEPALLHADRDAIDAARAALLDARIEAKARAFEARMERSADSASVGDTVASAMAFAAEITTEVALTSALGALDGGAGRTAHPVPVDTAADERRQHARRIRGALAVPYFSFAQGLRGAGS